METLTAITLVILSVAGLLWAAAAVNTLRDQRSSVTLETPTFTKKCNECNFRNDRCLVCGWLRNQKMPYPSADNTSDRIVREAASVIIPDEHCPRLMTVPRIDKNGETIRCVSCDEEMKAAKRIFVVCKTHLQFVDHVRIRKNSGDHRERTYVRDHTTLQGIRFTGDSVFDVEFDTTNGCTDRPDYADIVNMLHARGWNGEAPEAVKPKIGGFPLQEKYFASTEESSGISAGWRLDPAHGPQS